MFYIIKHEMFFTPSVYAERTIVTKANTFTYDNNGNLTNDGEKVYVYDALNRLVKVLEEGNESDIINAIGHIAKAIGMTKIANETGLSRPSLYKALSDGAKPQFATIVKVLKAIGGQIQISPSIG